MSGPSEYKDRHVKFDDAECIRVSQSGEALLVKVDGAEVWFPVSQIHEDSETWKPGTSGNLIVTRWIAEQKGLV